MLFRSETIGIKLDIEGSEFEVLSEAIAVLVSSYVRVIQFEFGEKTVLLKQSFSDFWNLMTRHGYIFYRFSKRKLLRIEDYNRILEIHINSTYYCVRSDKF